jgi:hypothetical protein
MPAPPAGDAMPEVCRSSSACTSAEPGPRNADGDMASTSAVAMGVGKMPEVRGQKGGG